MLAIWPRLTKARRREALEGLLFLSPWILGFLALSLFPVVGSMVLSFTRYQIITKPRFIGLDNYHRMLFVDKLFWPSVCRTLYYSAGAVVPGILCSLGAAMLLNQGLRGTSLYRTLFFLPSLTPAVCAAILWQWALHPEIGLVNFLLRKIGIEGPGWIYVKDWAIPSFIMISLWSSTGGNRMLIFLAALQGVPRELYESAELDGAGRWVKFASITVPMISPAIFFNLVLGVIGSFQVFTTSYIATGGGPAYATWFYALHLYQEAFVYFEMGYACALAWFLAFLVLALTGLQFLGSRKWVFYAGRTGGAG